MLILMVLIEEVTSVTQHFPAQWNITERNEIKWNEIKKC